MKRLLAHWLARHRVGVVRAAWALLALGLVCWLGWPGYWLVFFAVALRCCARYPGAALLAWLLLRR